MFRNDQWITKQILRLSPLNTQAAMNHQHQADENAQVTDNTENNIYKLISCVIWAERKYAVILVSPEY